MKKGHNDRIRADFFIVKCSNYNLNIKENLKILYHLQTRKKKDHNHIKQLAENFYIFGSVVVSNLL